MTTLRPTQAADVLPRPRRKGSVLAGWLSPTDHKVIGHGIEQTIPPISIREPRPD